VASVAFEPSFTWTRWRTTATTSSPRSVRALSGALIWSFLFTMKRPTRARSYRRGSMKNPRDTARAGPPGGGGRGPAGPERPQVIALDLLVDVEQDLARLLIHDAASRAPAFELLSAHRDPVHVELPELLDDLAGQLLSGLDHGLPVPGRPDVLGHLLVHMHLGGEPLPRHPPLQSEHLLQVVEERQDLFVAQDVLGLVAAVLQEPERAEKRRGGHLPASVDPDVGDVVGVEVELQPGAAGRNHPRGIEELPR